MTYAYYIRKRYQLSFCFGVAEVRLPTFVFDSNDSLAERPSIDECVFSIDHLSISMYALCSHIENDSKQSKLDFS